MSPQQLPQYHATETTLELVGDPMIRVQGSERRSVVGFIQRKDIIVGYDGDNNQSKFAGPGNVLRTSGVMNCIVIVVWDKGGQWAVMRHYDTRHAFLGSQRNPISGEKALTWNRGALTTLKTQMITQLKDNITPKEIAFAISLGQVWYDVDQESSR